LRTACLILSDPLCKKCLELEVERRDIKEDWDPEDADEAREALEARSPKSRKEFDSEEEAEENDAEEAVASS
jgi:hypothetical protein